MQGQSGFTQSDYTGGYAEILLVVVVGFFCFFFVRFFVFLFFGFFGPLGFMVLFTKGQKEIYFILLISTPWLFILGLYRLILWLILDRY